MMDFTVIQKAHYAWLVQMGWNKTNTLEDLALVTSEIGEAVNECRFGEITNNFEVELADIVLRVMGIAEKHEIDLEQVILRKMARNNEKGNYKNRIK